MPERETRRQRRERIREERKLGIKQARGRQRWIKGLAAVGVALVIAAGAGIGIRQYLQTEQQVEVESTVLGLRIDEDGFWRASRLGPQVGIITESRDRNTMDCLKPLGDFCVAEASPNFKVALNKPMLDFMFRQSDLINPSLPTRMIFIEDWLDARQEEHTGGFTAVSEDGSDQIIVISLKAAALFAFRDLEDKKLPEEDYFNGAVSFTLSRFAAHEFAHAGRQTKRYLKPGSSLIPDDLLEATHQQIYYFDGRYIDLYDQALGSGLGDSALIFIANLEKGVNLQNYRAQIFQEGGLLGIIK